MKKDITPTIFLRMWTVSMHVILLSVQLVLAILSEERCRLCQKLLGIAHLLFKMTKAEQELSKPAILFDDRDSGAFIKRSTVLCQSCFSNLMEQPVPDYGFPDFKVTNAIEVASGGLYSGELRDLIHRFKFSADRALLPDLVAVTLRANLSSSIGFNEEKERWLVVSVPLHWRRKTERGFNQAELIAKSISKRIGLAYSGRALKRTRRTTPQRELGHDARESNVNGAFKAHSATAKGKCFLIVDDICTSGATLAACAQALREAGADRIVAVTIAKAEMYLSPARFKATSEETELPGYNGVNLVRGDKCPINSS